MTNKKEQLEVLKNELKEIEMLKIYFYSTDEAYLSQLKDNGMSAEYVEKVGQSDFCKNKLNKISDFLENKIDELEKEIVSQRNIKKLDDFIK